MVNEKIYKNFDANLIEIYNKVDLNSILEACEISNERTLNKDTTKNVMYRPNNFGMFLRDENDEVVHYLTGAENNLVFKNLKDFISVTKKGNYFVFTNEDIESVKNSVDTGKTVKVNINELDLAVGRNYSFFEINTQNPDILNTAQRKYTEKIYGTNEDFYRNIENLSKVNIDFVRIDFEKNVESIVSNGEVKYGIPYFSGYDLRSNFNMRVMNKCEDVKFIYVRGVELKKHRIYPTSKREVYAALEKIKKCEELPKEARENISSIIYKYLN